MPKILLGVSSSFCANFLRGQVAFLVQHGFEVMIVSGPGEEISMLCKKENARLFTVDFTKRITPLTDFFQLLRLIRLIRKERPDIINAGNPKSGFLIMLACRITGHKKRIFTLHGLLSDTKRGVIRGLITATEKISCGIAHKVIVVSPTLKAHAEKRKILPLGKGMVIGRGSANGIDLYSFSRNEAILAHAMQLKKQFGFNGNEIVLGFIGRLSKDKGIDILFDAFNTLKTAYPFLRMVLAGPIVEENLFSKRLLHQLYHDENIFYPGKLSDVTALYEIIDILIVPSLREGFGNVLIEAAAMETPVVASDIPGCKDAVLPGINGELFEKGNTAALAAVLKKLITNKALRQQYGRNGREFVCDHFSNEEIWAGQLELYKNMLLTKGT
ncbi:glycosyltransferase family 4 protein [Agriterribacter sp.]|uniref:glycosyltransferase family 4 protein n=1 Tax=Agriterribacter sp. TaxID=2821509 RepID=UPI002C9ACB12|nr:glycosyltransferase family 4 protein [Agriterribacter sp.]HRO47942.1 glycosyltransferase family 4 protein [Agriterribacter sp.]HRQ18623.1 glycosyltransferase family 4 protein [Agriterribacter sp.]